MVISRNSKLLLVSSIHLRDSSLYVLCKAISGIKGVRARIHVNLKVVEQKSQHRLGLRRYHIALMSVDVDWTQRLLSRVENESNHVGLLPSDKKRKVMTCNVDPDPILI